jgi:hypothetical protein
MWSKDCLFPKYPENPLSRRPAPRYEEANEAAFSEMFAPLDDPVHYILLVRGPPLSHRCYRHTCCHMPWKKNPSLA